jgi:hypothetical protein
VQGGRCGAITTEIKTPYFKFRKWHMERQLDSAWTKLIQYSGRPDILYAQECGHEIDGQSTQCKVPWTPSAN